MLKERRILALAALVIVLCIAGLVHMFVLRYASGDVYPAYSSLRSDPKGAKVLCESLRRLPDVTVTRNLRELSRWTGTETGNTILFAGYNVWWFKYQDEEEVQRLMDLAAAGNRVVVALKPTTMREAREEDEEKAEKLEEYIESRRELKGKKATPAPSSSWNPWAAELQFEPLPDAAEERVVVFSPSPEADEIAVPWNSNAAFTHIGEFWSIVGHRDRMPVILERKTGKGSLVLCADSYFISNEAQLKERSTPFLVWLIGANRSVIFDETHLGISAQPGVASLMRKYRLHGLMAGLVLLAALFVWKNLFSLVPRLEEDLAETEVEGKDHAEGLVNLLRHNIPAKSLIPECARVWKNSTRFLPHLGPERQAEVEAAIAKNADARPETIYQRIQQILNKRN